MHIRGWGREKDHQFMVQNAFVFYAVSDCSAPGKLLPFLLFLTRRSLTCRALPPSYILYFVHAVYCVKDIRTVGSDVG